jgi:ParB/RepB/Spo0J family partition protein
MTPAIAERPVDASPTRRTYDNRFLVLLLEQLLESGHNPRRHFDETKLQELADSVREKGIVEPLVVRPLAGTDNQENQDDDERLYEIVAGARRHRAARLAGLTRVPCVVRDYSDEDVLELFLIENVQRDDLAPLEQARGFKQLLTANPEKYSAATIATKLGMSPAWVWDRLKLLDLVPEASALLDRGRIGIGHAIVLARLKAEHQAKAIDAATGGLWESEGRGLQLQDEDPGSELVDDYQDLKPRSIRELEAWIAHHVRFDVAHAAQAVPLEFGEVAARVEVAAAKPGRGKKVVSITYDTFTHPDAKTDERVYTPSSWARADGSIVRDEWAGQDLTAATCEHAVLGVVVVGRHYGRAFDVCIAKETCRVHWGDEIDRREKERKQRQKEALNGEPSDAGTRAIDAKRKDSEKRERERIARETWQKLQDAVIADAVAQVKSATKMPPTIGGVLGNVDLWRMNETLRNHLGKDWHKKPAAAWLVLAVDNPYTGSFGEYVKDIAKPLGLNIKRLEAICDKHAPAEAGAPANAKKPAKRR